MSNSPCPYGRRQVAALASMNVRAVTRHEDVDYYTRSSKPHRLSAIVGGVGPRFQPRNELGKFVSYERFHNLVAGAYEFGVWRDRQHGLIEKEEFTAVEIFPGGEGCPHWDPLGD